MEIPDHLTCLLRNLYAGQEAIVKTRQELVPNWERGMCMVKAVYCHPSYLPYIQNTSCNAGLDGAQAGIKIAGENMNNLRHSDDTSLITEREKELKILFMKIKEESEKAALKLNIHKMKIMASGPITSWQIDEETMETDTLCFLGLQNHCRQCL